MARIEAEEHGDKGRVREWLARAVNAPRDPAWTADGVVAEKWMPASPVTGALDAFEWRVPVAEIEPGEHGVLGHDIDGLIALGESRVAATDIEVQASTAAVTERASETIDAQVEQTSPVTARAASLIDAERMSRQDAPLPDPQSQAAREAPKMTRAPSARPAKAAEPAPATEKSSTPPTGGGTQPPRKPAPPRKETQKVFTPSPAPDDPGTDADEVDELGSPLRSFRV